MKKSLSSQSATQSCVFFFFILLVLFPDEKIFHLRSDASLRASFVLRSLCSRKSLRDEKFGGFFHHCRRFCWRAVCFCCRASLWSLPINVKSFCVPCGSLSDHKLRLKAFPSICLLRRPLPLLSSYGNCRAKSSNPLLCRSIRSAHGM